MSCIVLEQNDTTLQQFCMFKENSPPHLFLKDSAVILAIYRRTWWHGMVKQSPFRLKYLTCMTFRAPLLRLAIFFLGDVWARHSSFYVSSYGWNEWDRECTDVKMRSRDVLA